MKPHPLGHLIPSANTFGIPSTLDTMRTQALELLYSPNSGFLGVFMDHADWPGWARRIARYDADEFRHDTPGRFKLLSSLIDSLKSGAGECHSNARHALELWDEQGDEPFSKAQDYGTCIDASVDEGLTGTLGWRAARPEYREKFTRPVAWYEYAERGYCSDGQTLSQCASILKRTGLALMQAYSEGANKADLRGDDANEQLVARTWCKTGIPSWLEKITAERHPFEDGAITQFDADLTSLRSLFAEGGFLHSGSTYTSGGEGDPISPVGRVGPHAQTAWGYDDSEQFRSWYPARGGKSRTSDFPVMLHQTWGRKWSGWCPPAAWAPWWGPCPAGAWVWWATDVIRYLAPGSYAYLPRVKGVPSDAPPPPPPPEKIVITGTLTANLDGTAAGDFIVVPKPSL